MLLFMTQYTRNKEFCKSQSACRGKFLTCSGKSRSASESVSRCKIKGVAWSVRLNHSGAGFLIRRRSCGMCFQPPKVASLYGLRLNSSARLGASHYTAHLKAAFLTDTVCCCITCAPYAAPIFFFLCGECSDPSPSEVFVLSSLLSAAVASASAQRRKCRLAAAAAARIIGDRGKGCS